MTQSGCSAMGCGAPPSRDAVLPASPAPPASAGVSGELVPLQAASMTTVETHP